MSSAPSFDPERPEDAPRKKGGGWKWILIILLGLCGLCCCGIGGLGWYGYSQVAPSTDPQVAQKRVSEIVDFTAPADLKPIMSMSLFGQGTMVVYEGPNHTVLMILEAKGLPPEQLKKAMDEQLQKQNKGVRIEKSETKEFTIRGEKREFTVNHGKSDEGVEIRQVTGTFPSKGGTGIIMYMTPADSYDEEQVEELFSSMK